MPYKFRIENEALKELDDILGYLSNDLSNPTAAQNLFGAISEAIEILKTAPNGFDLSRSENLARAGVRQIPVENYCLLYIVDEPQKKFTVLHVKYAGSDLSKIAPPKD